MKVYTKAGDAGEMGLSGGERIAKDNGRVEAYGAVDELNRALGVARAALARRNAERPGDRVCKRSAWERGRLARPESSAGTGETPLLIVPGGQDGCAARVGVVPMDLIAMRVERHQR